jgi:hypothetical protein
MARVTENVTCTGRPSSDSVTAAGPPADPGELALTAAGFPGFRLWRETTGDGTRYVARALSLATHPYTVVTSSLSELAAALDAGPQDSRP